jgi:CBS-domain-containing membrane protein
MHYVMERRMMLTIKALAEGRDPSEVPDLLQAGMWLVLGLLSAGALVAVLFVVQWRRPLAVVLTGAMALAIAMLAQPPVVVTGVLVGAVIGLALPWTPFREELNAA